MSGALGSAQEAYRRKKMRLNNDLDANKNSVEAQLLHSNSQPEAAQDFMVEVSTEHLAVSESMTLISTQYLQHTFVYSSRGLTALLELPASLSTQ